MAGAGARLLGSVLLASTPAVHAAPSGIGGLVVSAPLPGFAAAPPGPTNGPLTASSFASQSSDPPVAASEFKHAAAEPGFAAYLRLWTSTDASAPAANDVAVELFRIPEHTRETTMLSELRQAYQGSGTSAFAVPGIPGAEGRSVSATQPIAARLRVVTFATGPYVAVVQVAARTAQNPAPVGVSQAIQASTSQYEALSGALAAPAPSRSPSAPGSAGTVSRAQGGSAMRLVLEVIGALVVLGALAWLVLQRRRRAPAPAPGLPVAAAPPAGDPAGDPVDPWGPDGIFAAMGAVVPGERRAVVEPDGTTRIAAAQTASPAADGEGTGPDSPDGLASPTHEPAAREEPEALRVGAAVGARATGVGTSGAWAEGAVDTTTSAPRRAPAVATTPATARTTVTAAASAVGKPDEPAPGTPAGWLPDPSGEPDQLRYWDGLAWTSHVARRTPVP